MQEDLTYTIDERDPQTGGIIRILAHLDNFGMAVAAYQQALLNWPNAHIVLRQKARVIRERCAD
jgi:hypothetical protein